eukprot:4310811-Amphidinium_carterae.1
MKVPSYSGCTTTQREDMDELLCRTSELSLVESCHRHALDWLLYAVWGVLETGRSEIPHPPEPPKPPETQRHSKATQN